MALAPSSLTCCAHAICSRAPRPVVACSPHGWPHTKHYADGRLSIASKKKASQDAEMHAHDVWAASDDFASQTQVLFSGVILMSFQLHVTGSCTWCPDAWTLAMGMTMGLVMICLSVMQPHAHDCTSKECQMKSMKHRDTASLATVGMLTCHASHRFGDNLCARHTVPWLAAHWAPVHSAMCLRVAWLPGEAVCCASPAALHPGAQQPRLTAGPVRQPS